VFGGTTSNTPADRALKRLVDNGWLHRIERRLVGGSRGGNGQYVYQLGREGFRLFDQGRWSLRAVSAHDLAIVDCYLVLHRLQAEGRLLVQGYATEPDCHLTIGKYFLKPDLYAELSRPNSEATIRFMFEVDMGTQTQPQMRDKFARYWGAHDLQDGAAWPDDTLVIFIAISDDRAKEITWLLDRWRKDWRGDIFRVRTLASFEAELH